MPSTLYTCENGGLSQRGRDYFRGIPEPCMDCLPRSAQERLGAASSQPGVVLLVAG